jgi:hypothetical protein
MEVAIVVVAFIALAGFRQWLQYRRRMMIQRRLAACGQSDQQVIITTSEEADTFAPLVENLDCRVFDFEAKILEPLR